MAARRRTRRDLPPDDELDDELADEAPPRRRRRRPWRLLAAAAILAALIAAAPMIVAKSPLRNVLLARALAGAPAQLAARDASFNWLGNQALAGVTLTDAQGAPLATVDVVTLERSLVALASNDRQLGRLVLTRPVFHLETRGGGSNVEELLRALQQAAQPAADASGATPRPTAIAVEIVDGKILGRDAGTGQQWQVDGLNATAATAPAGGLANLAAAGRITLADAAPLAAATGPAAAPVSGQFKLQLAPGDAGAYRLDLIADHLPLSPLEPWLARVVPAARLTGAASADLKLAVAAPDAVRVSAAGKVDLADVRFTSAALGGDLIELPTAALAVDAAVDGARLAARQLTVKSPWLEADATGEFNLAEFARADLAALPAADAALSARVDLPQLARMLPRTLELRPGVRIDSGQLEITARSAVGAAPAGPATPGVAAARETRRWTLAVVVEDLAGADGAREIRWSEPVEARHDSPDTPARPQHTRAIFRSAFGGVTAEAVDEGYQGEMNFNLAQLGEQLGQFVDLSAWRLAGTGRGKFTLRDAGAGRFVASSQLTLRAIDVRQQQRIVWTDPELRVELNAEGVRHGLAATRLEAATVLMRSPLDTLDLELLEPVDFSAPQSTWALRARGNGPLESFAGRLRPWVDGVPERLTGNASLAAEVRTAPGRVDLAVSQLEVGELRTQVAGVDLYERQVQARGDLRWDALERVVESRDFTFASETVAGAARGVVVRLADSGPPTVRGDVALRGDLERMSAWLGRAATPGALVPRGQAVGRVQLAADAGRATAHVVMTAEPLALVRSPGAPSASPFPAAAPGPPDAPPLSGPNVAWSEPKLELVADAAYTPADDRLELANLKLTGQTVQLAGAGSIEQVRTAGLVRGDVNVTYDAAQLATLLASYLGPGVRIDGANTARLVAQGRLHAPQAALSEPLMRNASTPLGPALSADLDAHWSRRWQISTEGGWTSANLYGLPIGPARLAANVREGQIQFAPLELAVGQGRLTAQPRVVLDPPPGELQLAAGPLASNIAISPEVSEAMLKYAAPMLAGATRTSGTFSMFLDSVQTPLGDPRRTRAAGRVTIHQLAVLPGPMLADVMRILRQVEMLSRKPQNLLDALGGQSQQSPSDPATKGITMTERTIDVQVIDGRVYHRNLEFLIDDVPVRSYGSVGFDQTLALVIEVPIQAKWVGSDAALQRLIGQTIQLPVTGTFSRWRIDERAIGQVVSQVGQAAVGGAIENEVGKALDKLFKPR